MGQRAMCNHLFLCHLFYHRGYCRFPPPHHCCKLPPTCGTRMFHSLRNRYLIIMTSLK